MKIGPVIQTVENKRFLMLFLLVDIRQSRTTRFQTSMSFCANCTKVDTNKLIGSKLIVDTALVQFSALSIF